MNTSVMTFEDSVKAKLKGIVADMIPEDRWDAIVRATVADFEKNDLPKLVKAELTEQYKAAISAEFSKPEWSGTWTDAQMQASAKVQEILVASAPLILASMIGAGSQQVMQNFYSALQNQGIRY
mgnify:CR=1